VSKEQIRAVLGPDAPQWMIDSCPSVEAARRNVDSRPAFKARLTPTTSAPLDKPRQSRPVPPNENAVPCTRTRVLADVEARRVDWLWDGRIARGAISLIDGDPGLGKSTATLDIAARVSRGAPMPFDGRGACEPATVVLMTAEDDLAATIRPRLNAAGADVRRVVAVEAMPTRRDPDAPPTLSPEDIGKLEREVTQLRAALVVIDPLMAFLSADVDANRDADVRRVLRVLAAMAQRTRAAVLIVRHLNKGMGSALYRGGGSIGIAGAARSVMLVGPEPKEDPDDGDNGVRVLASVKSNLAKLAPSIRWQLVDDREHGAARIEWLDVRDDITADRLTSPFPPRSEAKESKLDAAVAALRDVLADGPVPTKQAHAAVMDLVSCSQRTVEQARAQLGVEAETVRTPDGRRVLHVELRLPNKLACGPGELRTRQSSDNAEMPLVRRSANGAGRFGVASVSTVEDES
jgi:AAA domain